MAKFKVWDPDYDEPTHAIDAYDHADAAQSYGEQDTDGQIDSIYDRCGHIVCVRRDDDTVVRRFRIKAEYEPTFYAQEVDESGEAIPLEKQLEADDVPY